MTAPADVRAEAVVAALAGAGQRVTLPRRAVAHLVGARDGHFTAAQLMEDAEAAGAPIGRATVFRTLDLFASLGLVERVDLPGGNHALVVCQAVHHHHAICTRCGRSVDISDASLREALAAVERQTGFRMTAHRLEMFGVCAECAEAGAR